MQVAALIVAAGRGNRAGGGMPKQYRYIRGRSLLSHTMRALLGHAAITQVLVVIHPDDRAYYDAAAISDARVLPPCSGGATRRESVLAGLETLAGNPPDFVLIHDAARPFVDHATVDGVLRALNSHPAAFPALPVVDALWRAENGFAQKPVARDALFRAQTPQGFDFAQILMAHRSCKATAQDDVTVARAAGMAVAITPGAELNFKITLPDDFTRAEELLEADLDIRTGNGFDVHAFGPGDHVTLCGIRLPFAQGLVGHSDADVAMHALTDAIFGALAEGDIGQWFPPSEPEWKGAASEIFLKKSVERVDARGFRITNLDCTIICEFPKIGPHADVMRQEIARITGIDPDRISIKATTSERLGFTGRSEGIAALATATLVQA